MRTIVGGALVVVGRVMGSAMFVRRHRKLLRRSVS